MNEKVYLLSWKDETDYRSYNQIYRTKSDCIEEMIRQYDETYQFPIEEFNYTLEEKIKLVEEKNCYPPSIEEWGENYFKMEELEIK